MIAARLAGEFLAAVTTEGLAPDLPPSLRLLSLPGTPGPQEGASREMGGREVVLGGPEDLGRRYELLLDAGERRGRGAWYTPSALAAELVEAAIPDPSTFRGPLVDPACGGGAFLLAAADRLATTGATPGDVVGQLWGADIDPLAVAVTEAALWWWGARRGSPTRLAHLHVGDALTDLELPSAGAVVGNPPFLGQLRASTATAPAVRAGLRNRFGEVVRPYTDPAWLFLLSAVEATRPGGATVLIQPQSVLAARDAAPVRAAIDAIGALETTWLGGGDEFTAAVDVCAPVIRRVSEPATAGNDWVEALATSLGIPRIDLSGETAIADVADVFAGFRDEYYGLLAALVEGGSGPEVVTVGAIEPLALRPGPRRLAKRAWQRPHLDTSRVSGDRAGRWVTEQLAPKLLVATQTRVVEAVVDDRGALVGSTPAIVVRPTDPASLWHLAAALHAPCVSAWVARASAGTGLSAQVCRPTARLVASIPLPEPGPRWDEAADLARKIVSGDADLTELGPVADAAYGIDRPEVVTWWRSRLR